CSRKDVEQTNGLDSW
nr:immunoglobulin heavy chain junction region [Macaca mulatta]